MFVYYASMVLNARIDARPVDLEPIRSHFIPDVEQAIRLYQMAGNVDWELQSKILFANFLDLIGKSQDAVAIAAEVLPIARALRLEKTVKEAEWHVKGLPFHRQKEAEFQALIDQDPDVMMADHDDEKIKNFAQTSLEAMALPSDRLSNVERESMSLRRIARERLDWCRHIDLIQSISQTLNRSTLHSIDPDASASAADTGCARRLVHRIGNLSSQLSSKSTVRFARIVIRRDEGRSALMAARKKRREYRWGSTAVSSHS